MSILPLMPSSDAWTLPDELRRPRPRRLCLGVASISAILAASGPFAPAIAQQATSLNGPPVQVVPYVSEPGVPAIVINPGTPNPFPGSGGTGTGTGGGTGSGGSGSITGGNTGSSDALNTLLQQSWGASAISSASAMGVNPSALAATCVLESGCQNVGGSGSITGAFQMTGSTYTAMINKAIAENPALASQIVPGIAGQRDPATQAIAAAQYLKDGAAYLSSNGIANTTVLDVRSYFNFGPLGGANVANAASSDNMASQLSMYSQAQLRANGITPTTTVGQWRESVTARIGGASGQSVRT